MKEYINVNKKDIESNLLLRAKLHIPSIQSRLISRGRLDKELAEGLDSGFILVMAPAGYGKTTAVAKWLQGAQIPAAWFSIDESDNSLKRFWSYLIAALDSLIPGIENRFAQFFQTAAVAFHGAITALIDELYKYNSELILVLDDFHLIQDKAILESINFFVRFIPKNVHIVIVSRSYYKFGSERLKMALNAKEVKLQDLQFTIEEIKRLCEINEITLNENEILKLAENTEGWAAGLYLLLEALKNEGKADKLLLDVNLDSRRISYYLTEEVIDSWNEEEKDFMLRTSVLSSMCGSLCDALTGCSDGSEMLRRLSESNAFVISLDSEGSWYRYHHLYGEYLQKILDCKDSTLKDALLSKAGLWFESKGFFREAVSYYLQSRDYERVAEIIVAKGKDFLRIGDITTLLSWFKAMPEAVIESNDILCLTYAWALLLIDQIKDAMPWLNVIEDKFNSIYENNSFSSLELVIKGELEAIKVIVGIKQKKPEQVVESLQTFRAIFPSESSTFITYGINFNIGEASLLGGIFGLKGHLSLIDKEFAKVFDWGRTKLNNRFGYIPVLKGEILFERNRLDDAIRVLMQGAEEAKRSNSFGSFLPYTITLARIMKAKGNIDGAYAVIRDGERQLMDMGCMYMMPLLSAFKVRISIETGDMDAIDSWMNRNCLDMYDSPSISGMYEYITLARVLLFRNDYDSCMLLLHKLLLFAQNEGHIPCIIEILNLQAVVYNSQGQKLKAMEILKKSLAIGEREGYERIFAEEGLAMASLLGSFIKWNIKQNTEGSSSISPVYIRKLQKQNRDYCILIKTLTKNRQEKHEIPMSIKKPLTKREREVLNLINSELTNAEIAFTLGISINTVKVNCFNIYRKLGVKNREQALGCARELKLLS